MAFNLLKKQKNFIIRKIINERCIKINWPLDSPARKCEKRDRIGIFGVEDL